MRTSGIKIMLELIKLVKPLAHIMLITIVAGVIGFLCAIFITILGTYGFLNVLSISDTFSINTIIFLLMTLSILRGALRYLEQASGHYIAFKILATIRDLVFKSMRRLAPAKLETKDRGDLIAIITSDIELLEVFYAHTIAPISIAIITSSIMFIFISQYSLINAFIALIAYLTVGFVIPYFTSRIGKDNGLKFRDDFGKLNSYFLENLYGIKEIIQFNIPSERLTRINEYSEDLNESLGIVKKQEGIAKGLTDTSIQIFTITMLFVSIIQYYNQLLSFEGLVISVVALMSSFGPVVALSSLSTNLLQTLASGERVLRLLKEKPQVLPVFNKNDIVIKDISTEHVSFGYNDTLILDDISLTIKQGEITSINGRSGCGKSTFLRLIMRFFDVDKGMISLNDINIKDINTNSLRDNQSYVTQETYLFNMSILDNIRIAKNEATKEDVIKAAMKASVHDFIITLPNGYETKMGELGQKLSDGEKQRIGLARAFLHDAPLIILDEPTSNLDSLNEAVILKSLRERPKNKAIVIVSHRKSTNNIADVVYNLNNGRLT